MSIDLVAKGLDFSDLDMGYNAAVQSGLQYLNFFGGSARRAARNLGDDTAVDVVGSPVHGAVASLMTPNVNYVRTKTLQAPDTTLLICANLTDASALLMGTYYGPRVTGDGVNNARGLNLWTIQGTAGDGLVQIGCVAGATSGVSGAASANFDTPLLAQPVGWTFLSFSIGTAMHGYARNHTSGATRELDSAQQLDRNTVPFQIGSSPVAAGFAASTEIAFAAIYSRILTDVEKDAMYQSVKRYMAAKGIAV